MLERNKLTHGANMFVFEIRSVGFEEGKFPLSAYYPRF